MDTLYSQANNKEIRRFKEDHARKNSKIQKLLANHHHEPLPQEVLDVLANPADEILAMEVDNNLEIDAIVDDVDDEDLVAYD
jgi:hypothetical protein